MTRLEEQSRTREQNAAYLTSLLKQIPGITPARMYEGCTRNAYHLYMFRYDAGRLLRAAPSRVPQGARRGRRSRLERLLAAQQGAVPRGRALVAWLPGDLFEGPARRVARSKPLSGERSPVHGGRLADADDAARTAAGHGRHRRGGAKDAGARVAAHSRVSERRASESLRAQTLIPRPAAATGSRTSCLPRSPAG